MGEYFQISNEVFISVLKVIELKLTTLCFLFVVSLSFGTLLYLCQTTLFWQVEISSWQCTKGLLDKLSKHMKLNEFYTAGDLEIVYSTGHYFFKVDILTLVEHICRFWMLSVNKNEYICFWNSKMNNFCSYLAYISNFNWIFSVPNWSFTFYKCSTHIIDVWIPYLSICTLSARINTIL